MKSPHRHKKVKQIKRIRRWKKRSWIVLWSFIVLILFFLALLYTSLGVKLTTTVLSKVMPNIQFQQVSGTLHNLEVDDFSMRVDGVEVKVGQAELSLSGLCLIKGKICVENFAAKSVQVNIHTDAFATDENIDQQSEVSTKKSVISMPLAIELQHADLVNVEVNVDDMQFGLSSFQGRATWINEQIYISPTVVTGVKAIFPDQSAVTVSKTVKPTTDKLSISDTINDIFNKPLIASLPTVNIPLDIYVSSLKGEDWLLHIAGQDFRFNHIDIEASTKNNLIDAKLLKTSAKTPYGDADVSIKGSITLGDEWPIKADITAKTVVTDKQKPTELISNINGKLLGTLSANMKISGFNQADISTNINFAKTYMPITAKISGSSLQWPITGKYDYKLTDFLVDLSGSVKDYRLNVNGNFYGEGLPKVIFDMQSIGDNQSIEIRSLTTKLPLGEFSLAGKLNWLKELQWNTNIRFNKVDLSKDIPDYPIKLNGQLKTDGRFDTKSWTVNLKDMQLAGFVNHVPLQAQGDLVINSDQFIGANNFNIDWGQNSIKVNGSTEQENLVADLNLSDLKVIQQQLQGDISGHLTVEGSANQPTLKANLLIKHFAFQDILLNQAQITSHITYENMLKGNVVIKAKRFDIPNLIVNNADIVLSGDEQNHQLTINSEGKPISTTIKLEGHLNKNRTIWQGALSKAIIALNASNRWQINKPVEMKYNLATNQGRVEAHCWINGASKICLDNNVIIADQGEASVTLSKIDLKLFEIPDQGDTKITGTIQGNAKIKWDPKQKIPSIVANIDSNDVYVSQQIVSQTLPIPFDLFSINLTLNDQLAKLNWKFGFKDLGQFSGSVNIDDPIDQKRLSGQVNIDKLSLSIVNPLLNNNEHANGEINGKLKLTGTLLDPNIVGNISLKHSDIKAAQLPADIKSAMIDIDFKGKSSVLKGELKTNAGLVNITGSADWRDIERWNAFVTIKGAAIEVNFPPMVEMSVIPNLRIEASPDKLDMVGKINIPSAKITVESLPPSTVDVSSDEVMLNANLQEIAPPTSTMKINTKILVSLGDNVNIDAFGLNARLTGGVIVTQNSQGLTVNGQINILEGRFQAYGQDLIIRKGELFFAGPPEQPRLNIEAIRNPDSVENNVIAGIRVTGLADDPKAEVFSDPAMSQQEALSYLLRGQGLEGGDQSENDMMTALLIGLGTSQGGKFIGSIGNTFGIQNLSVDTQGVGNGQKVVVSGYLLPNLQVKYGIGIFDSLATFTIRYRLMPRLYLEAVSGIAQTVDLIYQFEF